MEIRIRQDTKGTGMLDDFFIRALIAGIGVALVAGPLGCLIVWRRMAYFGDTLAHAALLGVALGFLLEISATFAVFVVSLAVSVALLLLQRRGNLTSDSLLGLLSHASLALGLVVLGFMTWVRMDLMGLLFGDILAVSRSDIAVILAGGGLAIAVLIAFWRPLFAVTVNRELAEAEGIRADRANLIFMLLTAMVVAISMKVVGVLLITALLIVPPTAARRFASSPESMAVLAALIGAAAVVGGLSGSLQWDTPSGPSIVVAAFCLFLISLLPSGIVLSRIRRRQS